MHFWEQHNTRICVVSGSVTHFGIDESGWDKVADVVWTVEAPQSVVIQRVERRSGMSELDTKARIAAQFTRQERVDRADIVIENDATLEDLRNQISKLWESIP